MRAARGPRRPRRERGGPRPPRRALERAAELTSEPARRAPRRLVAPPSLGSLAGPRQAVRWRCRARGAARRRAGRGAAGARARDRVAAAGATRRGMPVLLAEAARTMLPAIRPAGLGLMLSATAAAWRSGERPRARRSRAHAGRDRAPAGRAGADASSPARRAASPADRRRRRRRCDAGRARRSRWGAMAEVVEQVLRARRRRDLSPATGGRRRGTTSAARSCAPRAAASAMLVETLGAARGASRAGRALRPMPRPTRTRRRARAARSAPRTPRCIRAGGPGLVAALRGDEESAGVTPTSCWRWRPQGLPLRPAWPSTRCARSTSATAAGTRRSCG